MTTSQSGSVSGSEVRERMMARAREIAGHPPKPQLRSIVCPYCGTVTPDGGRCTSCSGRFDPMSKQATQNQMGPWEVRDEQVPFRPGCSYATLIRLIEQGVISEDSVLRGPSTRQFWMLARHTPGVGHRFGHCHNCGAEVRPDAFSCPSCQVSFEVERDRQHMGLGPARPLPGQGLPEVLALHAEPASTPTGASIASTTLGTPSPQAQGTPEKGIEATGAAETRKRLEESLRLVQLWRNRANADRQHAWAVIIISGIITLSALSYVVFRGGAAIEPSENASEGVSSRE